MALFITGIEVLDTEQPQRQSTDTRFFAHVKFDLENMLKLSKRNLTSILRQKLLQFNYKFIAHGTQDYPAPVVIADDIKYHIYSLEGDIPFQTVVIAASAEFHIFDNGAKP